MLELELELGDRAHLEQIFKLYGMRQMRQKLLDQICQQEQIVIELALFLGLDSLLSFAASSRSISAILKYPKIELYVLRGKIRFCEERAKSSKSLVKTGFDLWFLPDRTPIFNNGNANVNGNGNNRLQNNYMKIMRIITTKFQSKSQNAAINKVKNKEYENKDNQQQPSPSPQIITPKKNLNTLFLQNWQAQQWQVKQEQPPPAPSLLHQTLAMIPRPHIELGFFFELPTVYQFIKTKIGQIYTKN